MDKRRFFTRFYFVLFTCLLILPYSKDVNGALWLLLGKAVDGIQNFYDAQSIISQNNSVRVSVKMVPEDEQSRVRQIASMRKTYPTIPDNWSYSTILYEIDCKDRTFRALQVMTYNTKNETIDSSSIENPDTKYITPDSMGEALYAAVCPKNDTKEQGP